MKMNLKEFIEKYKDEVNNRLFEKIYSLATAGELGQSDVGKFTELFYKCGIDPLEYLKYVPFCYAYGSALEYIKIPDRIIFISVRAFAFCNNLVSVVIPNSVTSIHYQAFYNCGVLTSVTIPDSVTSISSEVFYNCGELTSITIPDSVDFIGISAFRNCYRLTRLTIPSSVTSIGDYAFWGCNSLTAINYKGNKEQWGSISKGTNWGGGTSIKVIHCVDGDITL